MDIRKENQYNQSMGKYKILSTAAGVGSIITTKWGGFITLCGDKCTKIC